MCMYLRKKKPERQLGLSILRKCHLTGTFYFGEYSNIEIIRQGYINTKSTYTSNTLYNFVKLLFFEHTLQMWQIL